jgi:hypothetical protein
MSTSVFCFLKKEDVYYAYLRLYLLFLNYRYNLKHVYVCVSLSKKEDVFTHICIFIYL